MSNPQQTTREVIEQQQSALKHAIKWLNICDKPRECMPLHDALAAGRQALEQTQVEAEPEWNDENVIAYCIARGISAAKAFTTGATQPQATEPAPSTVGELTPDAISELIVEHKLMDQAWPTQKMLTAFALAASRSQPTTEESLLVAGAQPVRGPLEKDAARYLHICEQDFKDRQWVDGFAEFKKARDTTIDAAMGITGEPK